MPEPENRFRPLPINGHSSGLVHHKHSKFQVLLRTGGIVMAIIIGVIASLVIWYNVQLTPVGSDVSQLKKITIATGSTPSQIGKALEAQSIIRNATVFDICSRLSGKQNTLQAGTYRLSPAETTPQIMEHISNGLVDRFNITFYPGATLTDTAGKLGSNKYNVTTVLKKAGYSDQEITAALSKTYNSPLFAGKPSSASLEGYIYGETYNFNVGATVEDILRGAFAEFYKKVQSNKLIDSFASHDLNLYQGITLASIVQREASNPKDQKQIAQVFYSRLKQGMVLGSDVTYQYIADKTGIARDPNIDSPYNTRRYAGLPPGPIAAPGLSALQAVANPAEGDYLYFLSGDDGVMYFAHTDVEHEANITDHCKENCSTP